MTSSLAASLIVAVLAASDPGPAPGPPPSLREIGRVKAVTPYCQKVVELASTVASTAMDNDLRVQGLEFYMSSSDFDSSELAKAKGMHELERRYVSLRSSAADAETFVKQLRAAAAQAPADDQKREITAFANAVGGALNRQRAIADSLGRFMAYLEGQSPMNQDQKQDLTTQMLQNGNTYKTKGPLPIDDVPASLSEMVRWAAHDLQIRAEPIAGDEAAAASHIDAAFKRCE